MLSIKRLLLIAAVSGSSLMLEAESVPASAFDSVQREYEIRATAIRARHRAFLEREKQLEAKERRRLAGAEQQKRIRQNLAEKRERARERYVENRPPPKDDSEAERRYLAQQEKIEKKREELRAKFVDRRDRLKKMLSKEASIPLEKEVGLE